MGLKSFILWIDFNSKNHTNWTFCFIKHNQEKADIKKFAGFVDYILLFNFKWETYFCSVFSQSTFKKFSFGNPPPLLFSPTLLWIQKSSHRGTILFSPSVSFLFLFFMFFFPIPNYTILVCFMSRICLIFLNTHFF